MSGAWSLLAAAVVVLVVVAVGVGGHLLFRRYVPNAVLQRQNDVVGFTVSIVAVLYAVVLAFVVVVVWEEFVMAEDTVRREITTATSLHADSLVFGGRARIAPDLAAYAQTVACREWDAMQRGGEAPEASAAIDTLVRDVTAFEPRTERERITYGDALSLVHQQLALRSERLMRNSGGLLGVLWLSLIVGGAITIAFTYLLGAENFRLQLAATALLSLLIGVMFSVIVALNYPFRGVVHVGAEPWLEFYHSVTGHAASCAGGARAEVGTVS